MESRVKKYQELKETVDFCKATGTISRNFFIEDQLCLKVPLNIPQAQQQAAYTLIELDLEDAKAWLSDFHKLLGPRTTLKPRADLPRHEEYVLNESNISARALKGLWFSTIILYAKCFTEAKGRRVKLDRSSVPAHLRACHDKIMIYRHTLVAHAGEGQLESADLDLVISPENSAPQYWIKNNVSRLGYVDDRHEQFTFEDLIKEVHHHVIAKREKCGLATRDAVRKYSIIEWRKKASSLNGPG
jgi:hypothetical protein